MSDIRFGGRCEQHLCPMPCAACFSEKPTRGGFFDLPKLEACRHQEHSAPTHIYIPQGKGYRHICPGCGKETVLIGGVIE